MFINETFNWIICRQSLIIPYIECYTIPVPNPTTPQCPGRHFVYFNCTTIQQYNKKRKKKSKKKRKKKMKKSRKQQHKYMYRPTHNTKFLTKTHARC